MLHAAWRDGLVVVGHRGRVLDVQTLRSFASAVFGADEPLATEVVRLALPGRRPVTEMSAVAVPVARAAESFSGRSWMPWRTLSASLAWFAAAARLGDELAGAGLVAPTLTVQQGTGVARWVPMVDDDAGRWLAALASSMPPVVGALHPEAEPWQLTSAVVAAFADDAARVRAAGVELGDLLPAGRSAEARLGRQVLAALCTDDALVVPASPKDARALATVAGALTAWARPLTGRSPFADVHVWLRVEPPAPDTEDGEPPEDLPWLLVLGCSPATDPSLHVEAERVWSGDVPPGLDRDVASAALLLARRRLTVVAPTVVAGLHPLRPSAMEVPLPDLVRFLSDEAPAAEATGVRVLLPAWWTQRRRASVRGKATPAPAPVTSAGLEARSLATVDWRLVMGDEALDEGELARVAEAKAPLVFLRGRWVAFDPDDVRRALTSLTTATREKSLVTPLDLLRLAAEAEADPTAGAVEGTGWAAELLAGLPDHRLEAVVEPATFRGELRPYQRRGLGWLAFLTRLGLGGCLADDMGLGKTAQLLALEAHDRVAGDLPPTLVVCPLSVVRNWETEAERFTPHLRVEVHHGAERARGPELAARVAGAHLVVTTYATAARDVDALSKVGWHRLVADEAQHVKNPHTAAAKALRRIPASQKLALTGTPVENRLSELRAVLDLVNPGLLGSEQSFRDRFAVPIERHRDDGATARLRALTQPFLLRRSKADRSLVPELPPKVEQTAWAHLTREQATLYRSVVDQLLRRLHSLEGMERRGAILAAITRLKQVCNHPAHLLGDGSRLEGRSGKLTVFDELLTDALDADEQVLVFTQYREMGLLLVQHLHDRLGLHAPFLHGGVAKARRDRMVAEFQSGDGGPVLLVSLKAGGSGLNLTAASQVVHYDRWWNPAVEDQASDRAWRIGQRATVVVHKLVCVGTIEERVDRLIAEKQDLASRVVGAGEGWLTELSTDSLRELLVLREDR